MSTLKDPLVSLVVTVAHVGYGLKMTREEEVRMFPYIQVNLTFKRLTITAGNYR